MATKTASRRRGSSSRSRKKSPSQWWKDFKKTDRYKVINWIVRITFQVVKKVGDQPGANDKLRAGAAASARFGARRVVDIGDWLNLWNLGARVRGFGNDRLDLRELRAGVLTDSEFESYERIVVNRPDDVSREDAFERWVEIALADRQDRRGGVTISRDVQPVQPVQPVIPPLFDTPLPPVGGGSSFAPPPARRGKTTPSQPVPSRRPASRKVNRQAQLRAAWGVKFDAMKGPSMAADGNLNGALAQLRSFVEQQPGDRMQLHAQLAAFAQFFESLGEVAETMQATLERQLPDGTPGVPSSVTQHLGPVAEHGAQIGQCAKDTALAFEDRFAEAIRVAQDEEKPSDDYLRAPA